MGYTRYVQPNRAFTADEWTALCGTVLRFGRLAKVKLAGWDGKGRPTMDDEAISFNGSEADGDDMETFRLYRDDDARSFCKTGRRPYDVVVSAVLIASQRIAPGALTIDVDGGPEDWTAGSALCDRLGIMSRRRMADAVKATARARHMKVRYTGSGIFDVSSASEPGRVHTVSLGYGQAISDWVCSCPWGENAGAGCSHVRAVEAFQDRETASLQAAVAVMASAA